ncbi:ATP-binding cassette domain-containing protein [Pseudactinotalea sp. Z1739]|uniref:ATP-binding cassette domain-containing protein n=1 Tax=Pseudactinotalea sp. Z1739 TaxID=3413028 RepID=UPI003C7ECAFF
MTTGTIRLGGVRQNNLRDISLDLRKKSLIVVVGVSGSGKSSLVFDTIAAEAQRQINATFSAYAQNYLPSYGRPDADRIENLSAAIVIDQRRLHGGPRSTVATITDIGDGLRLLYARGATPSIGHANAFSFNDPAGMCLRCHGLGVEKILDVDAFIDTSASLREGPFAHPDYRPGTLTWRRYADSGLFDVDVPLEQYSMREMHLLLEAAAGEVEPTGAHDLPGDYEGVLVRFHRIQLAKDPATLKGEAKKAYERLVTLGPCTECDGTRLNEAARSAGIEGLTLPQGYAMQVGDLAGQLRGWDLGPLDALLDDVVTQLERLTSLGLGYLSLDRATATLSGGEAQRVKMVRHLGSTLNDMLYVFDEPTVGLHTRDVHRLAQMLQVLRDKGNTVVVVEHDRQVMEIADQVVEIGPGAGVHGGELIFQGSFEDLRRADTPTGSALRSPAARPREPREPTGFVRIENAASHNLKDVTVEIPLGVLTVVTGVAGSGKSSLIHGHLPVAAPDAVLIDQAPIRGSRRSTPASWTGMLDEIRRIFAKRTGQPAALFSPNSDGGCRACEGTGVNFLDLGFTDPVLTTCETCQGRRFRAGVLKYTVGGRSIADVFEMTVETAAEFFHDRKLSVLLRRADQVGLGYLALGQNLTTLSGGERQRLKLSRELTEDAGIIVLDEPTTGLHAKDTSRLLALLHEMVDDGRTIVVIEHDLDIVAGADHVIDLGPEGGHDGGRVQFTGPVPYLARTDTHTGRYLRARLGPGLA